MTSSTSESRTWSGPRPFVGRSDVIDRLMSEVDAAIEGEGRAVFLLGPEGSGKTACLGLFQELAYRSHKGLEAEYVDCVHSGARTWEELAEVFTRDVRIREGLKKVAFDWLDAVPVVGPLINAIGTTVQTIRRGRLDERKKVRLREPAEQSALKAVRMLLRYGGDFEHRLVIMDSFERGDAEDLAGTVALIRRLTETHTVFLASLRTSAGRPPERLNDLILEAERLGVASRVELPGLTREEVAETVGKATRADVPDEWVDWLHARTNGYPRPLWDLLGRLQQQGRLQKSGRSWSWEGSPGTMEAEPVSEIPEVMADLDPDDRRLLALAALEGPIFHSVILAELAGLDELEVEDRLAALCREGVLEHRGELDLGTEITSRYAFTGESARGLRSILTEREAVELSSRARRARARLGLDEAGPDVGTR